MAAGANAPIAWSPWPHILTDVPSSLPSKRAVLHRWDGVDRARDLAAHYVLSVARAVATLLPDRPRRHAAKLLGGLGPIPGTLENDWSARPTPQHPRPIVLLHGTNDTSAAFADLAQALRKHGYAVFALDYGKERTSARGRSGGAGTGDIFDSAPQIAAFIDNVLSTTGAERVDLVGHSQGGLHAHAFIRGAGRFDRPGHAAAHNVGKVVTLGSTVHGASPLGSLDQLAHARGVVPVLDTFLGPSARQQVRGSDVLAWLAAEADTAQDVGYTAIASRFDHTVRPPSAQHLAPGPNVRNIWLQDVQPDSTTSHADLPRDPTVIGLVLEALQG